MIDLPDHLKRKCANPLCPNRFIAKNVQQQYCSITMKTKTWLVLVGVLSTVRDESEVTDHLMTKIMDQIDG